MPQQHGPVAHPALLTNASLPRDDGSLHVFIFSLVEASARYDIPKANTVRAQSPGVVCDCVRACQHQHGMFFRQLFVRPLCNFSLCSERRKSRVSPTPSKGVPTTLLTVDAQKTRLAETRPDSARGQVSVAQYRVDVKGSMISVENYAVEQQLSSIRTRTVIAPQGTWTTKRPSMMAMAMRWRKCAGISWADIIT